MPLPAGANLGGPAASYEEKGDFIMNRRFSLPWVLLLGSLLVAPVASAGPKEDVAAATAKWAVTLGEDNPDAILPLYPKDAVLWATLSPTVRPDPPALRDS